MVGSGNGGFVAAGRPGEKNSGPANFRRLRKFRTLRKFLAPCKKFAAWEISRQKTTPQPTATPTKQKTKNYEETNL